MHQHLLLYVGRRALDPLVHALDAYVARLAALRPVRLLRVRPADQAREGAAILAHLPPQAHTTVLEVGGTPHSTDSLVAHLQQLRAAGRRQLAWVVGGAFGLDAPVRARAQASWCLTPLTLPHRLAHVVVAEQLYRAESILAGKAYHHA